MVVRRLIRLLKHRWMDDADRVISPAVLQRLTQKVTKSEQRHSGEIRICIEAGLPNRYLLQAQDLPSLTRQRALSQFGKLGVWDTEHNNGVLIYLLLAEHAIELVADRGINQHVDAAQWQAMVYALSGALRKGHFEEGLMQAVDTVTHVLVRHFPHQEGQANPNELPDQPTLS